MKVKEMTQVIVRLKPDLKEWIEARAEKEERSQNWLIGKLLEEARQREQQIANP